MSSIPRTLQVDERDNVLVALQDLAQGEQVESYVGSLSLNAHIPAKHKFNIHALQQGQPIVMYGVTVGEASQAIPAGSLLTQANVQHATDAYRVREPQLNWSQPDISSFSGQSFMGFRRQNGQVGTRNYWLVIPLVFCENKNVSVLEEILLQGLGYAKAQPYRIDFNQLIELYQRGESEQNLLAADLLANGPQSKPNAIFPNVDGIKFLTHQGGCGGTRQDSDVLCKLLAGYITHPNVAGATVLSLGCQNAQIQLLKDAIHALDKDFDKPVYYLEQQASRSVPHYIEAATKQTFVGLTKANKFQREAFPLSAISLGLECGGSDGFSGISANPTVGGVSDLLVSLGGKAILAEFPELNGVEQELINRCETDALAEKFTQLMRTYASRAEAVGSGFDMNPSPGNIKDGLITDAMKSAGAAKKGGRSPIRDVLDYTEPARKAGLNLLCTPGNDVESTTGLAGSGANLIVFTTGLGTPTGNPIVPVIKVSSNHKLSKRMADIIDWDCGDIIEGKNSIEKSAQDLLQFMIAVASGEKRTKAESLEQDDFIPWKRGISL
ncbi:MAG: altronate dehydratase family protein [Bacteroidota bacterium]